MWNAVASASWLALRVKTDTSACPAGWIASGGRVERTWSRGLASAALARGRLIVRCRTLPNETDAYPHITSLGHRHDACANCSANDRRVSPMHRDI